MRTWLLILGTGVLALALLPRAALAQQAPRPAPSMQPMGAKPASLLRARDATPSLPMAANGYCTVTLHDRQQWSRGEPTVGAMFDGRQYLFAGLREREIFAAAPIIYAPVLAGDCIVTFEETHVRVPGHSEFGLLRDGRVYFFADAAARARFVATPARYIDADLADGGRCIVSRVDSRRDIPGLPTTAIMSNGMRRLFAGAHEQLLYLQNPARYDAASDSPGLQAISVNALRGERPEGSAPEAPTSEGTVTEDDPTLENHETLASEPLLGGYCPVTIRTKGTWARGRYQDRAEIEGILTFFTAGPAEHDAIMADPAKYIPVLAGGCAVSLIDQDRKVRGSIYHAAEYQGRLFLFADAAHKAAFKADPAKYASVDAAAGGACVVTLAEQNRSQPGLAEFAAWHDGKLYRFLGAEQLKKFTETPERYAVKGDR